MPETGHVSETADADAPVRTLIQRPALMVHLDDTLRHLAETFADEYVGAAVVKGTNPPALVSERDVLSALAAGNDPDETWVRDVMTEDLVVAAPTDRIIDVTFRLLDDEIRHMPIMEDGVIVGVISARDALRVLAEQVRG
ncbi:MAG: CBS domain-containing protein [Acidimicrobiia bacterium]|jgi:signal-transduction protein with cAMP-binding, CBS, and nucleotidyltransferase domain